ncbi:Inositol-pentakisphosphate 2-kinase [Linum perenne]
MESKLDEKDAEDWIYRGEGAANLVLAYSGSSPAFAGKVMRMRKVARNGSSKIFKNQPVLTEHERLMWEETRELVASPNKEAAERHFAQFVMGPLLGPKHVDAGVLVSVSREFHKCVEKKLIGLRPASRVDAAKVDAERDSVVIMSDHTLFPRGNCEVGPCISVEIKPKCGFLPVSSFIAERNAVKKSTTRFRMHQALKLRNKEASSNPFSVIFHDSRQISEISKYNPLDLFSGSKERIHKAIKDLYATPQNNFRVFLNGSLILGGLGGGTSKTSTVIEKAFEDALNGVIHQTDGSRTASLMQLVAETVHHSGVLDRLLEVQKLDRYDIEGAIHAYYNVVSKPCMVCRDLKDAKSIEKCAYLHSIPMDESLKIVKDFLIAASAKDCSLMFSFAPTDDGHGSVHLPSSNQTYDYKVNYIDLDLKRLKKMEGYYELDQKIVKCYNQMGEGEHPKLNHASSLVHVAVN